MSTPANDQNRERAERAEFLADPINRVLLDDPEYASWWRENVNLPASEQRTFDDWKALGANR